MSYASRFISVLGSKLKIVSDLFNSLFSDEFKALNNAFPASLFVFFKESLNFFDFISSSLSG